MTDGRAKDTGQLFGDTLRLMRAHLGLVTAAWLVLTGLQVVIDVLGRGAQGLNFASFIASLTFQYEVTLVMLIDLGLAERRRRRLWALLGLNILSGLGIVLGILLLVLPGLYLFVRWSVAVPVLIAEEAAITESLRRSGEEISGRFWPVTGLFLLVYASWLVAMVAIAVVPASMTLVSSIAENMAVNLGLVGGWCAAVAVYAADKGDNRLAEVFA